MFWHWSCQSYVLTHLLACTSDMVSCIKQACALTCVVTCYSPTSVLKCVLTDRCSAIKTATSSDIVSVIRFGILYSKSYEILSFVLASTLAFYPASSGIYSDIIFVILSGIYSDILSRTLLGIYTVYSHIFFLVCILTFYLEWHVYGSVCWSSLWQVGNNKPWSLDSRTIALNSTFW